MKFKLSFYVLGRNFFRNQFGMRRRFWTTDPPQSFEPSSTPEPSKEPEVVQEEEEEEEEEEKDQMTAQEQVPHLTFYVLMFFKSWKEDQHIISEIAKH